MAHDRADDAFGITTPAQNVRAGEGMLVRRGKHLVVEVVEQTDYSPLIFVGGPVVITRRARAHCGFHGKGMLAQAIALRVLTQQLPGSGSIRHSRFKDGSFGAGGKITRACANHNFLARRRHLYVPVTLVVLFVEWIVTKQVLSAKLGGNLPERIRQRGECVRAQEASARFCGECFEILVCLGVSQIEHPLDGLFRTAWPWLARRGRRRIRLPGNTAAVRQPVLWRNTVVRQLTGKLVGVIWIRITLAPGSGFAAAAHDLFRQRHTEWSSATL